MNEFQVTPDDPWYIDPEDTAAVAEYVLEHVLGSVSCTHGRGFTYDFCPIANGNLKLAIDASRRYAGDVWLCSESSHETALVEGKCKIMYHNRDIPKNTKLRP